LDAFGISRLNPFKAVGMRLFEAGVIKRTYAFLGKDVSADIHDDNCTTINNLPTCTASATLDWALAEPEMNPNGTMNKPVVAIQQVGTNIRVSWVYVSGPPPAYTNPLTTYYIEWSSDNFVSVDGAGHSVAGATPLWIQKPATTDWSSFIDVPIATSFTSGSPTTEWKFRVYAGLPAVAINNDASDCYIQVSGVATCN
jgi:hypothetical protein